MFAESGALRSGAVPPVAAMGKCGCARPYLRPHTGETPYSMIFFRRPQRRPAIRPAEHDPVPAPSLRTRATAASVKIRSPGGLGHSNSCVRVRHRAARGGDGRMRVRPSLSTASYRRDTLLDGLLPPSAESGGAGAHDPRRSLRPPTSDGHRGARLPDRRRQEPKPLHEEDRSSAFGRRMRYALYRPRPTRGRYSGDYLPVRVRQGAVRLTAGNHASPEAPPRRPCLSRWTLFLRRPVPLRWGYSSLDRAPPPADCFSSGKPCLSRWTLFLRRPVSLRRGCSSLDRAAPPLRRTAFPPANRAFPDGPSFSDGPFLSDGGIPPSIGQPLPSGELLFPRRAVPPQARQTRLHGRVCTAGFTSCGCGTRCRRCRRPSPR